LFRTVFGPQWARGTNAATSHWSTLDTEHVGMLLLCIRNFRTFSIICILQHDSEISRVLWERRQRFRTIPFCGSGCLVLIRLLFDMEGMNSGSIFKFPNVVKEILQTSPAGGESGVDGASGYAWAFARSELLLWSYGAGSSASVTSHRLPYESSGHHYIQVLTYPVGRKECLLPKPFRETPFF
jgi:Nup133 N terminal like